MNEKYGTSEIRRGLALIIEIGNIAPAVSAAKTWYGKALALGPVIDELVALIKLKPALFLKQWNEYSHLERQKDMKWACEKFDLSDDILESQIESALLLLKSGSEWIEQVVAYVKGLKKK